MRIFLIEPYQIKDLSKIRTQLMTENILLFNSIDTFKGLERDVVVLLIPAFKDIKENKN